MGCAAVREYVKPIPIFSGYLQRDLLNFFTGQHAQPIEFNIGYQCKNNGSSVLLATKKPGAASKPRPRRNRNA